jgi:hypothetical protein
MQVWTESKKGIVNYPKHYIHISERSEQTHEYSCQICPCRNWDRPPSRYKIRASIPNRLIVKIRSSDSFLFSNLPTYFLNLVLLITSYLCFLSNVSNFLFFFIFHIFLSPVLKITVLFLLWTVLDASRKILIAENYKKWRFDYISKCENVSSYINISND